MASAIMSAGKVRAQRRPRTLPQIVITPYKTTLIAGGVDSALIKIHLVDTKDQDMLTASNLIHIEISGDATVYGEKDTTLGMVDGNLSFYLKSGTARGTVKLKITGDSLMTASSEIHTVYPGVAHPVTTNPPIAGKAVIKDKIIGADISFLPQMEARGIHFTDSTGKPVDVFEELKRHGFNYIRLRVFDHPETAKGYAPGKGFCDLEHTKAMAKRIKAAGMKFLLDIHYSDYWADPQQQNKPAAWADLDITTLKDSVYAYTKSVIQALKDQGTAPDMVQVGNEINHGILWPDGAVNNLDTLAQLLYAGIRGVKAVSPQTPIMLHLALGGQNAEARWFLDNMQARKVPFDVIGLSYYPTWHGTIADLAANMRDLSERYHTYVMVAEYAQKIADVNQTAFTAPGREALGTFFWEPLGTFFDRTGKETDVLSQYPVIAKKFGVQ
jgi:arabinogalactan endo-1,4-beta-galactosidase